ncbi:unnamed protein product [Prorocentrum cordatum]|uniref:Uncharacterized protein n=1 Tax=Prorocentrum cordatum TaxID=2364126 RepID=A0ABN9U9N4_9DINO|nr:unnamed protein product [Polarella glacialis]CAK0893746.1 unnamed protein product [Polarella glacialis]
MGLIRSYLWLREYPQGGILHGSLKQVQKKYKDHYGVPTVLWRPTGSIPFWYRSLCLLLFIIVRACIVAAIAVIGSGHIVRSETDDRILNIVGLFFIADLDDVVHNMCTPPPLHHILDTMPPMELGLLADPPEDDPSVPVTGVFMHFAAVVRIWTMATFWMFCTTILTYS